MGRFFLHCLLVGLLAQSVSAQSLLHQANRRFDELAYHKAIELYEQVLNRSVLAEEERLGVLTKLGYSYQQVRDAVNTERVYRVLFKDSESLPGDYVQCYLYYAQALASNGKYKEAQEVYEKYAGLQNEDGRGKQFSALYQDVSILTRNSGNYRVDYLDFNTDKAEFSPAYYKKGLVFVTDGREAHALKRVFTWNNTAFLDLYYMPEKTLETKTASLGGASAHVTRRRTPRLLGEDDYTVSTANDTRTVGFSGNPATSAEGNRVERPVTGSQAFSSTLNTKYHEGPVAFTKEGTRAYFTRNNYNRGRYRESADGINKLKLYAADFKNGNWGNVQELPFNGDDYSTGHPALNSTDKLLYFASDRPGGFGGTDLYVSRFRDGKWSQPINLGKEINTKGNELFPFVDDRGNLYFSSDGHPGLGDLDIFYAPLIDGTTAKFVQNLGEPINSSRDDFGLITDGERLAGYFSSNRRRGGSDDDIYRFRREGTLYACRELTIHVFDAQSKQPLGNARVEVVDQEGRDDKKELQTDGDGNIRLCLDPESDFLFSGIMEGFVSNRMGFSTKGLSDDQPLRLEMPLTRPKTGAVLANSRKPTQTKLHGAVVAQQNRKPLQGVRVTLRNNCDSVRQEVVTGADGRYQFAVTGECDYRLEATKSQWVTVSRRVTRDSASVINLTMFRAGDVVRVDNIYYDLDKWTIRPDAAKELDKLVDLLKQYPEMRIELRAHTDSRATTQYNKTLSTKRAQAVVAYLREQGIAANRMLAAGYGESQLLNDCKDLVPCTEEEHQQNRRTEIKILKPE